MATVKYSTGFIDKLVELFPKAKGLHYRAERGAPDIGHRIEEYINVVTEELFASSFTLLPHHAQEKFPKYLNDLRELHYRWQDESQSAAEQIEDEQEEAEF